MHVPMPLALVTYGNVVLCVFEHSGPKVSYSLDFFSEGFCTEVLLAYAIMCFSKGFLGLVWSKTLDKGNV